MSMNKVYIVEHEYAESDGDGYSMLWENEFVAVFSTKEKAEDFVKKHEREIAYESTNSGDCMCGSLYVEEKELDAIPSEEDMWWLRARNIYEEEEP